MKTLRLAFSRIATYFSENKIIFILYFIGTVVCVISTLFFYGNILKTVEKTDYSSLKYRTYTIQYNKPAEITPETLQKLKDFQAEYDIQDIVLHSVLDLEGNDFDCSDGSSVAQAYAMAGRLYSNEEKCAFGVETFINNNNNVYSGTPIQLFSDDELQQNVIISSSTTEKSIKIHGQDYEIIRSVPKNTEQFTLKENDDYYIPADAYFQSGIKTYEIEIYLTEPFSQSTSYNYTNFLRDLFDIEYDPHAGGIVDHNIIHDYLITPDNAYLKEYEYHRALYMEIISIFAASLFSFMFLLKYLMDSCRRENSILMMVGAKKSRILATNFLENIILTLSSTAIAILIHITLYDCLFSKINLSESIVYTAEDYLIIALSVFVLSTIVQIPFIISYWFKNIRNIKEGAK